MQVFSSISIGTHLLRSFLYKGGKSGAGRSGPDSLCIRRQFVHTSQAEKWLNLVPVCGLGTWDERAVYHEVSCLESGNCWILASAGAENTETRTRYFHSHYLLHT